jgi:hemoglobin-like flavoprotein
MPVRRHPVALSIQNDALEALPIDHELVDRLRASYAEMRVKDTRLAQIFYAKLFAAAPHLRALFRDSIEEQAHKLMASLDAVVQALDRPIENAARLGDLGRRHAEYGAKPEHYELVSDLLVASMRELLTPAVHEKMLAEWRMALTLISRQMIAAAASRK